MQKRKGLKLLILFLIHNALNWKWYKNIGKGKYSRFRILMVTHDKRMNE